MRKEYNFWGKVNSACKILEQGPEMSGEDKKTNMETFNKRMKMALKRACQRPKMCDSFNSCIVLNVHILKRNVIRYFEFSRKFMLGLTYNYKKTNLISPTLKILNWMLMSHI